MLHIRFSIFAGFVGFSVSTVAFGQGGAPQSNQPQAQLNQPGQGGVPGNAMAVPQIDEKTYHQQVGYLLGSNFGKGLRENEIDPDLESLIAGIKDALGGAQPKWTEAQLMPCKQRFEQEMQQKGTARMQQVADKNSQAAAKFLAENKTKPGVQVTASGLQYKVLQQGKGASPTVNDTVRCNYRGTLIDGTEFDSSYGRGEPAEFPVGGVIPGWTEALQKMHVGDKWQLFVPADLAYGSQPPGPPIEPNSLLVFEVELLGIKGQ
ncbi:MAG TPA: FKBP-type peptidyl-prolyl cis-trans isomerase [Lacipirellulaceae bacterium]|jgi:FKBP-type peptidyl-prolyl cis-trans isomerase FklB